MYCQKMRYLKKLEESIPLLAKVLISSRFSWKKLLFRLSFWFELKITNKSHKYAFFSRKKREIKKKEPFWQKENVYCSMLRNRTFQSTFSQKFGGLLRHWSYGSFATVWFEIKNSHIETNYAHFEFFNLLFINNQLFEFNRFNNFKNYILKWSILCFIFW